MKLDTLMMLLVSYSTNWLHVFIKTVLKKTCHNFVLCDQAVVPMKVKQRFFLHYICLLIYVTNRSLLIFKFTVFLLCFSVNILYIILFMIYRKGRVCHAKFSKRGVLNGVRRRAHQQERGYKEGKKLPFQFRKLYIFLFLIPGEKDMVGIQLCLWFYIVSNCLCFHNSNISLRLFKC